MKRNFNRFAIALGLAVLLHFSFDAAAKVEVVEANGNSLSDYSNDETIAIVITWINTHPVTVKVIVDKPVLSKLIETNIAARNDSKIKWNRFQIEISGKPNWKYINKICAWDGRFFEHRDLSNYTKPVYHRLDGTTVTIGFKPSIPSPGGLVLGTCGRREGMNWQIDTEGLKPGETFTMRLWPSPAQ